MFELSSACKIVLRRFAAFSHEHSMCSLIVPDAVIVGPQYPFSLLNHGDVDSFSAINVLYKLLQYIFNADSLE